MGQPFAQDHAAEVPMKLAGSEAFGTGVVHLTYVPSS